LACIWLTLTALWSRRRALDGVVRVLERLGADAQLRQVASRCAPLAPYPPPGATEVVSQRY
jgi:hypothetical protein